MWKYVMACVQWLVSKDSQTNSIQPFLTCHVWMSQKMMAALNEFKIRRICSENLWFRCFVLFMLHGMPSFKSGIPLLHGTPRRWALKMELLRSFEPWEKLQKSSMEIKWNPMEIKPLSSDWWNTAMLMLKTVFWDSKLEDSLSNLEILM